MIKLGIAFCGSFCTTRKAIEICKKLLNLGYELTPIFSENVQNTDTRFGKSEEIIEEILKICGKSAIKTIVSAETVGPNHLFDALLIAPCTGNTLAKLANGITDNTVTMATKSHLRNEKPVVIALATNDGLSANAHSIATLLNRKHYFFVPLGQDAPFDKPNSLVCDMEQVPQTIEHALMGKQIQPILI